MGSDAQAVMTESEPAWLLALEATLRCLLACPPRP